MQPIVQLVLFAIAFCLSTARDVKYGSPKAVGPCIHDRCPRGFQCDNAECVPDVNQIEELGPCVNNLCPKTYQCNDNVCIRPIPKAREGAEPIGPCVNDKCPDGHMCVPDDYKCYPME